MCRAAFVGDCDRQRDAETARRLCPIRNGMLHRFDVVSLVEIVKRSRHCRSEIIPGRELTSLRQFEHGSGRGRLLLDLGAKSLQAPAAIGFDAKARSFRFPQQTVLFR